MTIFYLLQDDDDLAYHDLTPTSKTPTVERVASVWVSTTFGESCLETPF